MTDEVKEATETSAPTIAPEETQEDDTETKLAKLEEEKENYRKAYLKVSQKNKEENESETDEDKMRRIAEEAVANSRLAEIDKEKDEIIKKALKENKELKASLLGQKNDAPATLGAHSESMPVTDTSITPEQMAFFKSKGWTEKDIERYKANLRKRPG